MRSHEQLRLNNGVTMPLIGLGTYSGQKDRRATELAVHMALEMGYRHFDTAKIYDSEAALGTALNDAISQQKVKRQDIFVTSKLWSSDHHDPVSALKQTLRNLGMEYVDMYLVHWPVKLKPWANYPVPLEDDFEVLDIETTWRGMEKCLDLGLCRCIGVSNFSSKKIEQLVDFASILPAVNQVEMHPMWRQSKLRETCGEHKIHVSGYSPLGGPGNSWGSTAVMDNSIIQSIAHKHRATPAQIALQWGLSKGSSVIVKSFHQGRMKENIESFDIKLDYEDLLSIDNLEERKIMRGEFLVNNNTSPYKSIHDLWDNEI